MTLSVAIRHRLGALTLDAAFESSGSLTALFGRSGSGKTSVVNIVGGLIRPDTGRVSVNGRTLVDTKTRTFVPKHRRRIGYVFQDARLFPHLTVAQNLQYGRFFTPPAERYSDLDRVVEMLGIGPLMDRRPGRLSGGEKQRVAIGRALVASPRLILMDEPFASLDEARKAEILPYVERLRDEAKIPILYVSHSLAEVARLATDIIVLADGTVTAAGSTSDVLQRLDLLPEDERGEGGAVLDMTVAAQDPAYGTTILTGPVGQIRVSEVAAPLGASVRARLRARDVMIAIEPPIGLSAQNVLRGTVAGLVPAGRMLMDVTVACNGVPLLARITRQSAETLQLAPGLEVYAVVKTVSVDRTSRPPVNPVG